MRMQQTHAPAIFSVIVFILFVCFFFFYRFRPSEIIRYVYTNKMHFCFDPLARAFSNRCDSDENSQRISVDRRPKQRVSMGLTDRRKTAQNLVDSRKNGKILTVSRK